MTKGNGAFTLRSYQVEAVDAVYEHLRTRDDNPCVVIPTGGGKTPVIATICRDAVQRWNGRVLILAHVRELLEQAAEKLRFIAPDLPIGICSAGLKRRDLGYAVTVAGIQSVYKRACQLDAIDLIIVDEAHMIPHEGDGMYRQFLAEARIVNPDVRIIGLTATPFRMKSGMICAPPPDGILNSICYEIGVRELIVQGYLCPLRTKAGTEKIDFQGLHVRAGEFVAGEVEDLMDEDGLVDSACAEIVEQTRERSSVLIFASGVQHGSHIVDRLEQAHGIECGFITGETPSNERDALLERFRNGDLKHLCNVNVLTTGFDAPNVDCVALVRPTMSSGLFCQMVGRGFRLCEGKTDCLVLDFGGNVLRHGPVDQIRLREQSSGNGEAPAKECPECNALIAAGYATCPECGHEFPPPEREKHDPSATSEGILSDQTSQWDASVSDVSYNIHHKRDDPTGEAPPTMRVEYRCGFNSWYREWVCFEHTGYASAKAEQWWRARSREPVPDTVEEAVELAEAGALAPTHRITIEKKAGEKYDRIVAHEIGEIPPRLEDPDNLPNEWAGAAAGISEEEIPF